MTRGTSTAAMTLRMVLGSSPILQVSVDKTIEVAVENPVHVRGLFARTVVLHELVRMEHVGPDLGSPFDLGLLSALRGDLLLALQLEEPGPQHTHRHLTILMLATLVLALGDDARREMRDPDCRVGLVDVLAAGPGGPVSIHLEILLLDLDLDGLADDRRDGYRGEAGVPPCAGVERADPDEAVHPALGGQKPESVLSGNCEGGALYARFLAFRVLDNLEIEAASLGPPAVHAGQHLGPILRVHPARARVYGEDGVAFVVLAGEEPRDLLLFEYPLDLSELLFDLGEQLAFLFGELEEFPRIRETLPQPVEELDPTL